jgi:hypothetical protein
MTGEEPYPDETVEAIARVMSSADSAHAILAAIERGDVPGVVFQTCGGCRGLGAHRRHCPRHADYHPWRLLADKAESVGDSIGVPELANRAWGLAGAIRAAIPEHPWRGLRRPPSEGSPDDA